MDAFGHFFTKRPAICDGHPLSLATASPSTDTALFFGVPAVLGQLLPAKDTADFPRLQGHRLDLSSTAPVSQLGTNRCHLCIIYNAYRPHIGVRVISFHLYLYLHHMF
jgi:hypothetical protein